jgi:ubiquinone/menaquinone biosynthesis C-methylase UbiE
MDTRRVGYRFASTPPDTHHAGDAVTHVNEYPDETVAMLELIWGEGFMSPGGRTHVLQMVEGIDLEGRDVLDIGCGLGGPASILARECGARVVGIDLEPPLIARARSRAESSGISDGTDFRVVTAGPLDFEDGSFDLVMSSGGITQTRDKPAVFSQCLRVLRPGGWLSIYDWMKCEGDYSEDMLYWFETEGLTYEMETAEHQVELLREAGFAEVSAVDRSDAYRSKVREEFERLRTDDFPRLVDLLGQAGAERAVENWRATVVVCEKEEMLQVYTRARRPGSRETDTPSEST